MRSALARVDVLSLLSEFGVSIDLSKDNHPTVYLTDQSRIGALGLISYLIGSRFVVRRTSSLPAPILGSLDSDNHLWADSNFLSSPRVDHSATPPSYNTVVELNSLIRQCIAERASDIHFEPAESSLLCRARIDGMLVNKITKNIEQAPEILSRIKIMSGLDIAERRRPQDGRIKYDDNGRSVDIRVSIVPTEFGEKAVLRILDRNQLNLDLATLGMLPEQFEIFTKSISFPNGLILVTGPTGSGKTTTLYAALNQLRSESINISTVEDPIEYYLEGINQTQVKPAINLTFAAMLRALLRQDPNVIMIGEIRDRETLDIALRAAMTGHLVLSTVHTNSALATIPRLLDMGAEPFLLASSLRLIVAQRLVRLNCVDCLTEAPTEVDIEAARKLELNFSSLARSSRGCPHCNYVGYKGRTAVYEMLEIDKVIGDAIAKNKPENEICDIALSRGFLEMAKAALTVINSGKSTPSEILRELSAS